MIHERFNEKFSEIQMPFSLVESPKQMTNANQQLQMAIDSVYKEFSSCRKPNFIQYCECCMDEAEITILLKPKLKELSASDLDKYTWKLLLTVGDVSDFKYFLPRIFEITANNEGAIDYEVVLRKLNLANWNSWDANQRQSVSNLLAEIWKRTLESESSEIDSWLCALGQCFDDLDEFISMINDDKRLIELFEWNSEALLRGELSNGFWEGRPFQMKQVRDWLASPETQNRIMNAYGL